MYFGWYIVGAGFLISLYVSGSINLGFTAVFEPIAKDFGWSYTQISFAASLRGLETGLLAPVAGILMDRWGPRRLILGGALLNGLGLMLLSRITSLTMFYAAFFLIAAGVSTATTGLLTAMVAKWFRKKAGFAMGITASGVAFGGLLIPLITFLIDSFGWRCAMMIVGLGMWAIPLPLSLILRHKPEQYGYLPDGKENGSGFDEVHANPKNKQEIDINTKAALSSLTFWIIAVAFFCHIMPLSAVLTHIMPYLSSIGIERSTASLIASALPLLTVIGRIGFGWLGDRLDKGSVTALSFAMTSLGVFLLGLVAAGRFWVIVAFIIILSIGWGGAIPMISGLLREYFGRQRLATIVGFAGSVMMVGMMVGAPLAGWVFDKWGCYQPAWFFLAGVVGLSAIVFYACLNSRSMQKLAMNQ
ncbi:MAG: MFS transporter [Desulfobacteraceae bacterium]